MMEEVLIFPFTANMPKKWSTAYKPDDIVTAEGRTVILLQNVEKDKKQLQLA